MPSLGQRVGFEAPSNRATFVSLSQNNNPGSAPSGAGPASNSSSPRNGWSTDITLAAVAPSFGLAASLSHDHVLRNHAVGSTCKSAASGPALVTRIDISMSVGSFFA